MSGVEWVPGSHIVHFILDAVEQLLITDFRVNDRGTGSEGLPALQFAWQGESLAGVDPGLREL